MKSNCVRRVEIRPVLIDFVILMLLPIIYYILDVSSN